MKRYKGLTGKLVALASVITLVVSFSLLILTPLPVSASTTVGGQITSDTTWTKANSPYIVTSSVLVSEGITLTIEPGVVVKFESAKGMQVNGQLIARGTEAEPIVFTSNQASPAPGDWCNILFTDSSVDTTYDEDGNYLSGCIMQYCTVEYGGGSDTPAVKIVHSSPLIDHCMVVNNANTGIHVEYGSPVIHNSTIAYNGDRGIYATNFEYTGGPALEGFTDSPRIDNNTISDNSGSGVYIDDAYNLIITDNVITDNAGSNGGGIYIYWNHGYGNGSVISRNDILDNGGGGICVYFQQNALDISTNTISGNSATLRGGAVYVERAPSGETLITGNIIINNLAPCGTALYFQEEGAGGSLSVTNNTFWDNSLDGPTIALACGQATINFNTFGGNASCFVENLAGQGSPHVDATNNWWGTTDEATIQAHIYDWNDDASLGIVDYIPYLTSEVDTTHPESPVVSDDGGITTSTTQLHATWSAGDPESGIAEYQYTIGSSPGATDVVPWTSAGTNTEVTHTGLNLTVGTTYYFAVKAKNGQGLWSDVGTSDGITVQGTPNQPPNRPSNISPIDAASDISLTPTLQSSAFSDPDAGDTQAASWWQIRDDPGCYCSPTFDSLRDTTNLTSITIPSETLNHSTTYYWHVKHQDNRGAWSNWSSETSFVTESAPTISLSPSSFNFTATQGGANPPSQTLEVWNSGGGTLTWSLSDDAAWLNLSPTSGSCTGQHDSVTVSVDISGMSAGSYNATITISAPGATNTPQTASLSLFIVTAVSCLNPDVTIIDQGITNDPANDPAHYDSANMPPDVIWEDAKGFYVEAEGPDGSYEFFITFETAVESGFTLYKMPDWIDTPYTTVGSNTIQVQLDIVDGVLDPSFVLAKEAPSEGGGLSVGATVGIAIGGCALAVAIYFAVRKWVWKTR